MPAEIIVVANEKGGSGKTTVAMHVAIGLLHRGFRVGTIDLDIRQRSLTRYLDNRRENRDSGALPMPLHRLVAPSDLDSRSQAQVEDAAAPGEAIDDLAAAACDVVVIDCPAGIGTLTRLAHLRADILVTPLNDSFVDLDPLLQFGPGRMRVMALGGYFQMLWQARRERAASGRAAFAWVVLRNRLSGLADQNKRTLGRVLDAIAPVMRFALVGGLGERIIFRQLFHQGLTVFDRTPADGAATPSQIRAREELQVLLDALPLGALSS